MKKLFLESMLLAAFGFFATQTISATSWRIHHDANKNPHFTDLNAAMSSSDVVDGDTLYLDPGCTLSSNQTVTKQVTIVGCGYFRDGAPHSIATISGKIYLKAANIKMEGVLVTGDTQFQAEHVTLERCKLEYVNLSNSSSIKCHYATIRQCYVRRIICTAVTSNIKNAYYATIENSIIWNPSGGTLFNLSRATIRNNVIYATGKFGTSSTLYRTFENLSECTITNNIAITADGASTDRHNGIFSEIIDCTVSHNVLSGNATQSAANWPEYVANNLWLDSNDLSLVFAQEGSNDAVYQLKADSPAKGYADDGGDCGAFDGPYPYVLSGMPYGYPYYTGNINVSSTVRNGKVNVSLQIQVQDE